jgi:plasmid stabilization system protein ParE
MVEFSLEALDALEAIRRDERFTQQKAEEMARKIVDRCNLLDVTPRGGYRGRAPNTRELIVKPFIVVFEIAPTGVKIINIWHGRQNRSAPSQN